MEICTRLALAHPDAVDSIIAAMRGHMDRAARVDRAMLESLLLLLDPVTGQDGARRLGALADPRAIGPLVHAAETSPEPVALAAVHALIRYPSSTAALARLLDDRDLDLDVRVAVGQALGEQGTPEAGDALIRTLKAGHLPRTLRVALAAVVEARFPSRVAELRSSVNRRSTPWLMAGGTYTLGYTLASAGHLGQFDLEIVGGAAGSTAGATLGYIWGRAGALEAGDAAFLTTSAMLGSVGTLLVVGGAAELDDENEYWLGGLGGEVLGIGGAWALRDLHRGEPVDSVEASFVSLASTLGVATATTLALKGSCRNWDEQWNYCSDRSVSYAEEATVASGAGMLGGLVIGHAVAPHVDLDGAGLVLVGLGGSWGLASGLSLPFNRLRAQSALPFLGLSAGALTGYGLAPALDPQADTLTGGFAGLGYGLAGGFGLGLLLDAEHVESSQLGALVGGSTGMVAGYLLTHQNPTGVRVDDSILTAIVTGFTLAQTAGWVEVTPHATRAEGLNTLIPAVVGAGTAVASPLLEVDVGQTLAATSLSLWGGYMGGAVAELTDRTGDDWGRSLLIGTDVGMGAGILVMAPPLNASPGVVGLADAGGVLTGALAALGTSFATDDGDTILVASMVGGGLGAVGGAVLGTRLLQEGNTREVAEAEETPEPPGVADAPADRADGSPVTWSVTPTAFPNPTGEGVLWGAQLGVYRW